MNVGHPELKTLSHPALAEGPQRRRRAWLLALLAIGLVIWGLTDVRRRARIEPNNMFAHKTDVTVYTEAARAFFDGRDPYEVTNSRGWHYLYPPLFALLMAPLAVLNPQGQAVAWYFISLLFCWGCWQECRRLLVLLSDEKVAAPPVPAWLPWLAAAAVALPVLNTLQRGQVGMLLVYLLLLGFRLVLCGRSWQDAVVGGVVLALPIVIKLTPVMPVGALALLLFGAALTSRWSKEATQRAYGGTLGLVCGMLLFVVLLPGMALGPAGNARHLENWYSRVILHGDAEREDDLALHSLRNQSLANAVYRMGNLQAHLLAGGPDDRIVDDPNRNRAMIMPMDHPLAGRLVLFVRLSLTALLLTVIVAVGLRGDRLALAAAFGLACAATLALSPLSRGHYFAMWLPGLLFVPLWHWRLGMTRWALGLSLSAPLLVGAHYLALDSMGRVGLLGFGVTGWCTCAMYSLLRGTRGAAATTASLVSEAEPVAMQRAA